MGGVIIDGTAGVLFKGPLSNFERVVIGLKRIEDRSNGLKIDTVPLPDKGATILRLQFRGGMADFEDVLTGLEKLRSSVAIDTVPLPDLPTIGTWPQPDRPGARISWAVSIITKFPRKRR